ncbi:hypothetical protein U1Q18_048280 [Sarracenia purpurea var. burkii]
MEYTTTNRNLGLSKTDLGTRVLDSDISQSLSTRSEPNRPCRNQIGGRRRSPRPFRPLAKRVDLVEVCHPNNCNIGLLAYSPLGGGSLTGKYIDIDSEAAKRGRLNLFPGYMERYNKSVAKEATIQYIEVAKKHGLTPVQLALGFARDRPFMTSSIVGATSVDQLKEDIDAFLTTERPLPPEVMADIENVFKRYKDPAIA